MTTVLFHHIFSTEQRLTRYIFYAVLMSSKKTKCTAAGMVKKCSLRKINIKTNLRGGGIQKEIANPGIIHIRLITESPGEY